MSKHHHEKDDATCDVEHSIGHNLPSVVQSKKHELLTTTSGAHTHGLQSIAVRAIRRHTNNTLEQRYRT